MLALISGASAGSCMLPMKLLQRWRWENLWFVFSFFALLLLPWTVAWILIPKPASVYRSIPLSQLAAPVLFGAGWGIGQILFGLTVARLGLALGYAIVMGCVAVLGTLVPLATTTASHASLVLCLTGVWIMVFAITLSGWAGCIRERNAEVPRAQPQSYLTSLLLAIACGLLSPMLNFAFTFSEGIRQAAMGGGVSAALASSAVWPVVLSAGFVPNLVYSVYLLRRNRSWNAFKSYAPDAVWSVIMAAAWIGSLLLYGISALQLGKLGTSLGWAIVQAVALVTAGTVGVLRKEWLRVSDLGRKLHFAGMSLFVIAIVVITLGIAE
jgi:L-rhamnose-H+ transport protein